MLAFWLRRLLLIVIIIIRLLSDGSVVGYLADSALVY